MFVLAIYTLSIMLNFSILQSSHLSTLQSFVWSIPTWTFSDAFCLTRMNREEVWTCKDHKDMYSVHPNESFFSWYFLKGSGGERIGCWLLKSPKLPRREETIKKKLYIAPQGNWNMISSWKALSIQPYEFSRREK